MPPVLSPGCINGSSAVQGGCKDDSILKDEKLGSIYHREGLPTTPLEQEHGTVPIWAHALYRMQSRMHVQGRSSCFLRVNETC